MNIRSDHPSDGSHRAWSTLETLMLSCETMVELIDDLRSYHHDKELCTDFEPFFNRLVPIDELGNLPSLEGAVTPYGQQLQRLQVSQESAIKTLANLWGQIRLGLMKAYRHAEIILDRAFNTVDDVYEQAQQLVKVAGRLTGRPKQVTLVLSAPGRLTVNGRVSTRFEGEVANLRAVCDQLYGQYAEDTGRFYDDVIGHFSRTDRQVEPLKAVPPRLRAATQAVSGGDEPMYRTPTVLGDRAVFTPKLPQSTQLTELRQVPSPGNTEQLFPTLTVDEIWKVARSVSDLMSTLRTYRRREITLRQKRVKLLDIVDRYIHSITRRAELSQEDRVQFNRNTRQFAADHGGVLKAMTVHVLRVSRAALHYGERSATQYQKQ